MLISKLGSFPSAKSSPSSMVKFRKWNTSFIMATKIWLIFVLVYKGSLSWAQGSLYYVQRLIFVCKGSLFLVQRLIVLFKGSLFSRTKARCLVFEGSLSCVQRPIVLMFRLIVSMFKGLFFEC